MDTLKIIDPLKQNITNFLAADTLNLLHSVEPTKRLSDLKKAYDEAIEGFVLNNVEFNHSHHSM